MMWFNVCGYYIIMNMKKQRAAKDAGWKVDFLAVVFMGIAALETYIYYHVQWLYAMFLFVYTATLLGVSAWSVRYIISTDSTTPGHRHLAKQVFQSACVAFYLIGFGCWVVDMNFCAHLLPLYEHVYGATLVSAVWF